MNELQFNLKDYFGMVEYIDTIKKPTDKKLMCTQIYDLLIENVQKLNIVIINDFYEKNKQYINRKIDINHYNLIKANSDELKKNDFLRSLLIFTSINDDLENLIDKPLISKEDMDTILKKSTATMSFLHRICIDPLNFDEAKPYLEELFGIDYSYE